MRRRRRRNYPLTVKVKGKKLRYRTLVKKYGRKRAKKIWRKRRKYHGSTDTVCKTPRKRRRNAIRIRRRGRHFRR